MAKKNGENTFMRITNEDIYNEIKSISNSIEELRINIEITKKKTSLLQNLVMGSFGFSMAVLGFLVAHILNK